MRRRTDVIGRYEAWGLNSFSFSPGSSGLALGTASYFSDNGAGYGYTRSPATAPPPASTAASPTGGSL